MKKAGTERNKELNEKGDKVGKKTEVAFLDDYVREKETWAELADMEDDVNIPMTIRLNVATVAILDHLAERWKNNRASIAADLLGGVIWEAFRRVHETETKEEVSALMDKLLREFMDKKKGKKR